MSDSFETPWTVANQAPLSMEFSRQEYWSGLPFPSPEDLPDPGIEPASLTLAGEFFTTESSGKPTETVESTKYKTFTLWPLTETIFPCVHLAVCIYSTLKCPSESLVYFQLSYVFIFELLNFSVYYRDNFFVRCIWEKYFIQVFVLTLYFFKRYFSKKKRF